jgi:Domain of unknown function (DUF4129)
MTGFRHAVRTADRLAAGFSCVWMSRIAGLLVLGIWLAGVPPLAAQTPADIARATSDLAATLDLQTEFPTKKPDEAAVPNLMSIETARVLLWIAVFCGAGVLAYFVRDILPAFGFGGQPRWDDGADPAAPPRPGVGEAARVAADELAAQGRFVEAMHVLLLQGLDEMRRRLDLRFADSLTSREIVSRSNAPGDAKAALRDIIAWVERAYFGDHPAGVSEYDACRRSFVALDQALRAPAHPAAGRP